MRKRLILVLLLALIASAEGTSVNAGSFNVTFDMGIQSPCRASVSSGDSAFLINVNCGNYSAAIMGCKPQEQAYPRQTAMSAIYWAGSMSPRPAFTPGL